MRKLLSTSLIVNIVLILFIILKPPIRGNLNIAIKRTTSMSRAFMRHSIESSSISINDELTTMSLERQLDVFSIIYDMDRKKNQWVLASIQNVIDIIRELKLKKSFKISPTLKLLLQANDKDDIDLFLLEHAKKPKKTSG